MSKRVRTMFVILAIVLPAVLFGCGGGGTTTTANNSTAKTVTGVAATGAVIAGTIYLKDSSVPSVQMSTVIGPDGSYSFDVTNLTAPFMLKAVGTANGQNYTLYSLAGGVGIANVNPVTHLAVTRAYGGSDPASIYATMTPTQVQALHTSLETALTELQNLLRPIMTSLSLSTDSNFIDPPFARKPLILIGGGSTCS